VDYKAGKEACPVNCPFCGERQHIVYHEYDYVCEDCGVAVGRLGYESRERKGRAWMEVPEGVLLIKAEEAV
jgi:hypothetical protein